MRRFADLMLLFLRAFASSLLFGFGYGIISRPRPTRLKCAATSARATMVVKHSSTSGTCHPTTMQVPRGAISFSMTHSNARVLARILRPTKFVIIKHKALLGQGTPLQQRAGIMVRMEVTMVLPPPQTFAHTTSTTRPLYRMRSVITVTLIGQR